jgi:hypothetical protein
VSLERKNKKLHPPSSMIFMDQYLMQILTVLWVAQKIRMNPRKQRRQQIANVRNHLINMFLVLEQEFEEGFGKLIIYIRQDGERILGLKEFS